MHILFLGAIPVVTLMLSVAILNVLRKLIV